MNAKSSSALVALLCGACVSQGKYDEALKNAADARTAAQRAVAETAEQDKARDANAARWATQLRTVQTGLEEEQARSGELRMALVAAGVKVDSRSRSGRSGYRSMGSSEGDLFIPCLGIVVSFA